MNILYLTYWYCWCILTFFKNKYCITIISWTIYHQANVVIVTGLSVTDRNMRKRQSLSLFLCKSKVTLSLCSSFSIIFQLHTWLETHIFKSQHVSVMRGNVTASLRDWIPFLRIPNDQHTQLPVKKKNMNVKWSPRGKHARELKEACYWLIFKGVILLAGIIRHLCVFACMCTFTCVLPDKIIDWFWKIEIQETSLWLCTETKWSLCCIF